MIATADYLRSLEEWRRWSVKYLFNPRGRGDRLCYNDGTADGWAVQSHLCAAAAYAVLAADPELDETRAGASRDEVRETALKMCRFAACTVQGGPDTCTDGRQWIRALGVIRFIHGLNALNPWLTDEDHARVRHMFAVHAASLCANRIGAGVFRDNRPESNYWNGLLLLEAAHRYGDHPDRDLWLETATKYFLNSLSIPQDARSSELYSGRPLSEWHIGHNLTEHFGMNHHGYINIGYKVIVLSQAAMTYFAMKERGLEAPPEAFLHVYDLWRVVRLCTFDDGRLLRIGGDTRVRYCYCQDYAVPMWLGMLAKYGENQCAELESRWFKTVSFEQRHNRDGSYLSERLAALERESPFYYARLESDRAVVASMGAWWRRRFPDELARHRMPAREQAPARGGWCDPVLGGIVVRGENRIASWRWRYSPGGMCLPQDRSDMAEWGDRQTSNLFGQVLGTGNINDFSGCPAGSPENPTISVLRELGDSGFLTAGEVLQESRDPQGEGESAKHILARRNAVFALPDDRTMIVFQLAVALMDCFIRRVRTPGIVIPNDIFNGDSRLYRFEGGSRVLGSRPGRDEIIETGSSWVIVDDCLGIAMLYGGDNLRILRSAGRHISVKDKPAMTSLYADVICSVNEEATRHVAENEIVLDDGFAVLAGTGAEATRFLVPTRMDAGEDLVRAVSVKDAAGCSWLAVANFGKTFAEPSFRIPGGEAAEDSTGGAVHAMPDGLLVPRMEPRGAALFRLKPFHAPDHPNPGRPFLHKSSSIS